MCVCMLMHLQPNTTRGKRELAHPDTCLHECEMEVAAVGGRMHAQVKRFRGNVAREKGRNVDVFHQLYAKRHASCVRKAIQASVYIPAARYEVNVVSDLSSSRFAVCARSRMLLMSSSV